MFTRSHLKVFPGLFSMLLVFSAYAGARQPGVLMDAGVGLHREFLDRLNREIDAEIRNFENDPYQETTPLEPLEPRWAGLGFIPFSRAYGISVYPNTVPGQEERGSLLAAFAAPGEDEPLVFGIRTLESRLEGLSIQVGDLVCMDTVGYIAAENIELGVVEYFRVRWGRGSSAKKWRYHPARIWPLKSYPGSPFCGPAGGGKLWISPETAQHFWLTVHVPSEAPAGQYAGSISLDTNRDSYSIPLYFSVLPLPLAPLAERNLILQGLFMQGPQDREACRDLAVHGVNATSQVYDPRQMPVEFIRGRFSFDFGLQDAFMSRLAEQGIRGPHIIYAAGGMDAALDRTLSAASNLALDDPAYLPAYAQAVRSIFSHGSKAGWNPLFWGILERSGPDSSNLAWFTARARAVKNLAGSTIPLVAPLIQGQEEEIKSLSPDVDVWLASEGLDELIFSLSAASNKRARTWGYASCTQRNSAGESRYSVGFGPWYRALDAVFVWAYNWIGGGHPWNDFDAPVMDWMLSYRNLEDRYLPTPAWEGFREGVDDRRYILTLEMLQSSLAADHPQARESRLALSKLRPLMTGARVDSLPIPLLEETPLSTDKTPMGLARALIAGHIIRLARLAPR